MGLPHLPEIWKRVWDEWDLRIFMLVSFSLQITLIFLAPLRKRTGNNWLMVILWSAYLLADWAAGFAVGLLSKSLADSFKTKSSSSSRRRSSARDTSAIFSALWSPFLILHLGGPDTITAYFLEDNELWLRHLLGLVAQCVAAVYIYVQSLPDNKCWIPTSLMFVAGIIKYGERTRSLYCGSLNGFRESLLKEPDPGTNYAKLMDVYFSKKEASLPTSIEIVLADRDQDDKNLLKSTQSGTKLTHDEILRHAYDFFETFKGLFVDLLFSLRDRKRSRDFFRNRTAEDAFKVVEVELNFMYEALFTKFSVVYTKVGFFARFISLASVVVSLGLFYTESKDIFHRVDVAITYILLVGAIALDIIAGLMLIWSDWFHVQVKKIINSNWFQARIKKTIVPDKTAHKPSEEMPQKNATGQQQIDQRHSDHSNYFGKVKQFFTRKWSETIPQFNLISYCLNARQPEKEKFMGYLGLTKFLNSLKYVKNKPFTDEVRDFIFEELRRKSEIAGDDLARAKQISSSRGDWVLYHKSDTEFSHADFLRFISDVDYDQSLILWHIATELCYFDKEDSRRQYIDEEDKKFQKYREISKLLSDYMMYLLVQQPTIMSAVTGFGYIRFRDTCAEAKKFLKVEEGGKAPTICQVIKYLILRVFKYLLIFPLLAEKAKKSGDDKDKEHRIACGSILGVTPVSVDPEVIKSDNSEALLFTGRVLAHRLKQDVKDEKWEFISKVWVEMLSYAAINCKANIHAQQLSKGGELITLVWLLMVHFGLGHQYGSTQKGLRAKIIAGK